MYRNSANKIIATKNKIICFPNNRSFSLSRTKKINWKPSSGTSEVKYYKRLIYKQFVQVSGLCGPQFLSYLTKRFTHLCRALYGDAILVHRFGAPITKIAKKSGVHFSIKALSFHSRTSICARKSSNSWSSYTVENQEDRLFLQGDSILILVSRTVKTRNSNCCIFEMKHATGLETCTKIYFLFIFNLV